MTAPRRRTVYAITERTTPEGPRSYWTKVGQAHENRDGSLTIKLDAIPLNGTLQVKDEGPDRRTTKEGTQDRRCCQDCRCPDDCRDTTCPCHAAQTRGEGWCG